MKTLKTYWGTTLISNLTSRGSLTFKRFLFGKINKRSRPLKRIGVWIRSNSPILTTILIMILLASCAPVFSDLQSARTLKKGNFEGTPYYTNTGADSKNKGASHTGFNFGLGLSDNIDIRGRLEYLWLNGEEGTGTFILGVGPKIGIVPDRISFFFPVGTTTQGGIWQVQPTLFLTQPIVADKFEITIAPKYIFSICEDCGNYFTTNLSLAFSKDLNKYAWRVEYGRLIQQGGGAGQLSVGYSFILNKNRVK